MEKKELRSDKAASEKSEIIRKFVAVLDKHCRNEHEVWHIIKTLQDTSDLMETTIWKYERDHGFHARHIRGYLDKAPEHIAEAYDNMDDTVSEALIIGGQNAVGLHLLNTFAMRDDINEIIDEYNY
jgi:hypothetical protein